MKQIHLFKSFLTVAVLGAASATVNAQNYHPNAFGTMGTTYAAPNYYSDYVGLNVLCTAPASVAGSLLYSTPGGSTTGAWGGVISTPLVNMPLKLPPLADSCGCSPIPTGYFTGFVALIWRGPEATPCEFGVKAYNAQLAGATACIIINEYAGAGPVGMAAGASGGMVTIPVFMIANIPGAAIDSALDGEALVTITISPWGINVPNDLGFVSGGTAGWAGYAVPVSQLDGTSSPVPYLGLDGAFVANFGSHTATNVKVAATLKFNGSTIHTDTTENLPSFPTTDSIWAMFAPNLYNVNALTTGRFDLTYNILSDSVDGNPANNSTTTSFYASDSVYSKGTYDFTNNVPISSFATGPSPASDFVWGDMYYVKHGGEVLSSVQWSLNNGFAGFFAGGPSVNVLVFQWQDGSNGQPLDSVLQAGELHLISIAGYVFGASDSSETILKTSPLGFAGGLGDTLDGTYRGPVLLDDNSWYYVAVDVPSGFNLYCDGQLDAYPRVFGRANNPINSYLDYSNIVFENDFTLPIPGVPGSFPAPYTDATTFLPVAFGNAGNLDSFNFNSQKGLIPNVPLIVRPLPSAPPSVVKSVASTAKELSVFPIPTADNLTVSLNLSETAHTVTYSVLDGLGRFVSKQTHNNVQNEQFNIATNQFASGTYFLVVNVDGRAMSRTFIVNR